MRNLLLLVLVLITLESSGQEFRKHKGFHFGVGMGNLFLMPDFNKGDYVDRDYALYDDHFGVDVFYFKGTNPLYIEWVLEYRFNENFFFRSGFHYRNRRYEWYGADAKFDEPSQREQGTSFTTNSPFHFAMQMYSVPFVFVKSFDLGQRRTFLNVQAGLAWDQYKMNRRFHEFETFGVMSARAQAQNPFTEPWNYIRYETRTELSAVTEYEFGPAYYLSLRYGLGVERRLKNGGRAILDFEFVDNRLLNEYFQTYIEIRSVDNIHNIESEANEVLHTTSDTYRFSRFQAGLKVGIKYFFGEFKMNSFEPRSKKGKKSKKGCENQIE